MVPRGQQVLRGSRSRRVAHKSFPGGLCHRGCKFPRMFAPSFGRDLKSRKLWASEIFSLNDSSEVDYARQVICEALSAYSELSSINENFSDEPRFMDTYKGWNTHVCCFSARSDLLSQWRAYGGQGDGFAIGFSPGLLKKEGDGPPIRFSVFPIVYSRGDQVSALHSFLGETLQIARLTALTASNRKAVMFEIAMALLVMMAPLKNPVFSESKSGGSW
jgi:hypothetical protein